MLSLERLPPRGLISCIEPNSHDANRDCILRSLRQRSARAQFACRSKIATAGDSLCVASGVPPRAERGQLERSATVSCNCWTRTHEAITTSAKSLAGHTDRTRPCLGRIGPIIKPCDYSVIFWRCYGTKGQCGPIWIH
jgi:hypothetical protein